MRQAILTKYLGPTDHNGSRIKAKAQAGAIIVHWDDALDVGQNHRQAAEKLARKFNWEFKRLEGGGLPDDSGYAFVVI